MPKTNRVWNCYDPAVGYPQPAKFGLGQVVKGVHYPPNGLSSHEVTGLLTAGVDSRFYNTTADNEITAIAQSEIDAIIQADADRKTLVLARRPAARTRLINLITNAPLRAIKGPQDAIDYASTNGAEITAGRALFIALNCARLLLSATDDANYPGNE